MVSMKHERPDYDSTSKRGGESENQDLSLSLSFNKECNVRRRITSTDTIHRLLYVLMSHSHWQMSVSAFSQNSLLWGKNYLTRLDCVHARILILIYKYTKTKHASSDDKHEYCIFRRSNHKMHCKTSNVKNRWHSLTGEEVFRNEIKFRSSRQLRTLEPLSRKLKENL